ncbi:hypothetical protein [Actinoallomurus acanthiterrae]
MLHSTAGEGACCVHLLFPALKDLHVQGVEDHGDAVLITARTTTQEESCPECGVSSARVHSRYAFCGIWRRADGR